jgi:hypothetical protein
VAGLQVSVAQATFPSDAEEPYVLPALETYADRMARIGDSNGAEVWGVSRRQVEAHNPFPFGGGYIDD